MDLVLGLPELVAILLAVSIILDVAAWRTFGASPAEPAGTPASKS